MISAQASDTPIIINTFLTTTLLLDNKQPMDKSLPIDSCAPEHRNIAACVHAPVLNFRPTPEYNCGLHTKT